MGPWDPERLLLDVWREVGRHLELDQSVSLLGARISVDLPLERLWVRRLDPVGGRVDSLAGWPVLDGDRRTVLTPAQVQETLDWLSGGQAHLFEAGDTGTLHAAWVPTSERGAPWVAAFPLPVEDGPTRSVLVCAGERALGDHLALWVELAEPFSAAIANDRRIHELARLREAAEADKRALLSRLDRQDVADAVVGSEAGLRPVMDRVEQVARTDAPVLILGETGSGKEVVARAIHRRSPRANGPFLRVNCGAIPPELVDSELFGHERGSFTGAVAARQGWFERADGGTLFLDELGELPPAAQVRLLRVLQDGSFERVGGSRTRTADVRIVAATHRPMQDLVREGRFREDLWYRVSVFPITLPPLRERPGDIPTLAAHFAHKAGQRLHGVALEPTPSDILMLQAYGWPGNVRELAAVIERAAILGDGRHLDVPSALGVLPSRAPAASVPAVVPEAPEGGAPSAGGADGLSRLEEVNRQAIMEALRATRGRVEGPTGAAQLLGLHPATLRSRMRRLGIEWSQFRRRR
jgi:hydrogenase-4 transcriptional activator